MRAKGRRGAMALIAVFIYLIFSVLGLGLVHISRIYGKLGRHKKNIALLEYSVENGIKEGYGILAERIVAREGPQALSEEGFALLRSDAEAGGLGIAEAALKCVFPLHSEGTAGDQTWRAEVSLSRAALSPRDGFFLAEYKGAVSAEGELRGISIRKRASLDAALSLLAGRVPLAYFPFLIAGDQTPEERQTYVQDPNIEILAQGNAGVTPRFSFAGPSIIPRNANPLVKRGLKIELMTPDTLTRAELRSALGLDMVNEPVPEGVYLVANDTGLGGVYVQGDLDEMALAIEANDQLVSFRQNGGVWLLRFNPAASRTLFTTPVETRAFDRRPLGIILVNGRIRSLGGGIVNASGGVELTKDEAIPCLLRGLSLTIVSSDEVTLTSHLIQQGVEWLEGIPYLKDPASQLIIYANGLDFVENTQKAGRIVIDPNAPQELKVQAALTAAGSVELGGSGKKLVLSGGLQAGGLALNGNSLRLLPDARLLENRSAPLNSPLTGVPVLQVLSLRPTQWNSN